MEPEVREFLKRVSLSIGLAILWMVINTTVGIMFGWAFYDDHVTKGNIIFYIWLLASLAVTIWLFVRLWRNKI